jgi:hypothetical protein
MSDVRLLNTITGECTVTSGADRFHDVPFEFKMYQE